MEDSFSTELVIGYHKILGLGDFVKNLNIETGYFSIFVKFNFAFETNTSCSFFISAGDNLERDRYILFKSICQMIQRARSAYKNIDDSKERLLLAYLRELRADYEDVVFKPKELGSTRDAEVSRAIIKLDSDGYKKVNLSWFPGDFNINIFHDSEMMDPKLNGSNVTDDYLKNLGAHIFSLLRLNTLEELSVSNYGKNPFIKYEGML